jgi:hypothetical protein
MSARDDTREWRAEREKEEEELDSIRESTPRAIQLCVVIYRSGIIIGDKSHADSSWDGFYGNE